MYYNANRDWRLKTKGVAAVNKNAKDPDKLGDLITIKVQ